MFKIKAGTSKTYSLLGTEASGLIFSCHGFFVFFPLGPLGYLNTKILGTLTHVSSWEFYKGLFPGVRMMTAMIWGK